jgi:hypothetical protein
MARRSSQYARLATWIAEGLAVPQRVAARRCGCAQGQLSKLCRGHLPKAWDRERYCRGLELSEAELVRLIQGGAGWQLPLWVAAEGKEAQEAVALPAGGDRRKAASA